MARLVFNSKAFPGMSESTFLSRSFGDQGVRLRIRKEPRSLLWASNNPSCGTMLTELPIRRKRSGNSSLRSDAVPRGFANASPAAPPDTALHSQRAPVGMYSGRYSGLGEPSPKRQRTSVDLGERNISYVEQRAPYGTYPARDQTANVFSPTYSQGPQSAFSNMSDYSFGHQRTNSSSASSPFVSPHTEVSGHSWPGTNLYYQPSMKDTSYTYPQGQYSDMQFNRPNQLTEPVFRQRTQNLLSSNVPSQTLPSQSLPSQNLPSRLPASTNFTFPRSQESENSPTASYGQITRFVPSSSTLSDQSARLPPTDQIADFASPGRQQYSNTPISNVLPPLESTLSSNQNRRGSQSVLPSHVLPSIEPQTLINAPNEPVPEHGQESYEGHESYNNTSFNYSLTDQKRPVGG